MEQWRLPKTSVSPPEGASFSAASAAVRILRAADRTMQRRLAQVSTELAQTDTELLCERAHSQHLAQERQEVAERERSLSRQVDVAVVVIAALREQLNASENQLEQRERYRCCQQTGRTAGQVTPRDLSVQGGHHHPEVPGSGGATGEKRQSPDPAFHRGPAETHRSGREAAGVLPGQRQQPAGG